MTHMQTLAELEDISATTRAYKNITVAVLALLLYEYFITFDREIGIAWSHKLSWGKAIFLFSRYIGLLLVLQGFAFEFLPGPIFSCAFLAHFSNIVKIAQYAACASFSGLRAYTVSGSNKIITSLVVILAAVPPVVTTIVFEITNVDHLQSIDPLSIRLCTADMALDKMEYFSVVLLGLCPVLASELMVVVTIVLYSWRVYRAGGQLLSLTQLLLREGLLYFIAYAFLGMLFVVIAIIPNPMYPTLVSIALGAMPPVLISRFYIHMDDWDREPQKVQWSHRRRTALQDASSLLSGV